MSNQDEFLAWCGNLFDESPEDLSMQTTREEIEGWDSMGTLLLMADLDEMHDIQITEEDILELKTLQDISDLIQSKKS